MKLIKVDKLLQHLSNWWLSELPGQKITVINNVIQKTAANNMIEECIRIVEEQPTAFDFDKVMEELKDLNMTAVDIANIRCTEYADGFVEGVEKAIEIIRGNMK